MHTPAPALTEPLALHLHADAVFHAGLARRFRALARTCTTPAIRRECQRDALRHERCVQHVAVRTEALLQQDAALGAAQRAAFAAAE